MAESNSAISDAMIDFSGGMDSYTSPLLLERNQFVYSVNMQIKTGKRGISTRHGYREVILRFKNESEESFFRASSTAIQGCGYHLHNNKIIMLCSCNNRIFALFEISK